MLLRIVAWNVNMALPRKLPALQALRPSIAVLQEVARADVPGPECSWTGHLPHKGVAVVTGDGFSVRRHPSWDPRIEFVVPYEVFGPVEFVLLSTWVMHSRAVERYPETPNRWQMLQALDAYEPLLRERPCVVAGDFNNAVRWDRPGRPSNHALAVSRMAELGLVSAYHAANSVEQGDEPEATLYWTWNRERTYHIDFIFMPTAWLPAVTQVRVGSYDEWVSSRLSDHVPVMVELETDSLPR